MKRRDAAGKTPAGGALDVPASSRATVAWGRLQREWVIGGSAAVAVAVSIASAPDLRGALGACLALLMLAIAAVDARRFIIPNELNAIAFALGLLHAVVARGEFTILEAAAMALLRAGVLALLFLALREAYRRLRGRDGIGLGDVKLAAVAGAWLDWVAMPLAVEIAALAALVLYAAAHFAGGRPMRATRRIPFGLFLAPAIWLAWLLAPMLFTY
jgi:leader peptidase (prepilin peptidase) / N-methyltransferase